MTADYSTFSEKDFSDAFIEFYDMLTKKKTSNSIPLAYILGGQSGAGKTTIHDIIQESDPNIIVIDGDRFRERHPNFEIIQRLYGNDAANYTQKFSNSIVTALIDRLSSERYNLVIEGTCRTSDVPLNTCRQLKAKGYKVELAVMCTDKDVSWQSTIDRYNEMKRLGLYPRAVPKEKYLATVAAIPENISVIYNSREFDEITLYNRERECLYRLTDTPDLNPTKIVKNKLNEIEQMRKVFDESDEILKENPYLKKKIGEAEVLILKDCDKDLSEAEMIRKRYDARNTAIKSNPTLKAEYIAARDEFRLRKANRNRAANNKLPKNPHKH